MIEFDFDNTDIFDLTKNASSKTENMSAIIISGNNNSWVEGTYENLINLLKNSKHSRSWIHQRNIYDLFLWLVVMPLNFWNLITIENNFKIILNSFSSILRVGIYIYAFIIFTLLYRFLFNYFRWVFPYMEFYREDIRKGNKHRIALTFFTAVILYPLICDGLKFIIGKIFLAD
jgi:hypothetical protein